MCVQCVPPFLFICFVCFGRLSLKEKDLFSSCKAGGGLYTRVLSAQASEMLANTASLVLPVSVLPEVMG